MAVDAEVAEPIAFEEDDNSDEKLDASDTRRFGPSEGDNGSSTAVAPAGGWGRIEL